MTPITTVPAMTCDGILDRGEFRPASGGPGAAWADATIEQTQVSGRLRTHEFVIHIGHLPVTTVAECDCYLN
jgi:hypothetical protein